MDIKKICIALLILIAACKSEEKDRHSLEARVEEFLKANDEMDLEKISNYIYPKVYELIPRSQLLQHMQQEFYNSGFTEEMESPKVRKIHPEFELGTGHYAKVDYSMEIQVKFKTSNNTASNEPAMILPDTTGSKQAPPTQATGRALLEKKYGVENISYDEKANTCKIRLKSSLFAVKDQDSKEWSFVNMKEQDSLMNKLFSKDVLDKLATYQ